MKKLKLVLIFILIPFAIQAQIILKERRVYYLDCSYSMVTNKIWNVVCDNLKKAIDNVNDETTELVVVPFALGHDGGLEVYSEFATSSGKEKLKNQISSINPDRSSMTYHYVPLQDFYNNRCDSEKVTYMFLMTDGQDEYDNKSKFQDMMKKWEEKYGDKNIYGFYVMLHECAQNQVIENICNCQNHLWKVETADINVNLIRLQTNAVFNARNDNYFELPIYGNADGIVLNAAFDGTSPYRVDKTEIKKQKLRVHVKFDGDVYSLPESEIYPLKISKTKVGKYDLLVTDEIRVTCESKKERSLKISVK